MNILIKNADFSEVSIGKVDTLVELEKKSIITNGFLESTGIAYISSGSKLFGVDVSSLVGKTIEIKGYLGSTKCLGVFYTVDCPTTDITFSSTSDSNSFKHSMGGTGTLLKYPDDSSGIITKSVVVPDGAKSLFVYVSTENMDGLYAKYSII